MYTTEGMRASESAANEAVSYAAATGSGAESGGSNHQGSKKRRKMRLLWKMVGVAVRRFASFRRRKVNWSESEPSDEEVDSKKCTKKRY